MSEDQNEPLTNHDYDGIQEFDNPLPTWWLATFFITIIFSFIYFLHYYSGSGPTLQQELDVAMRELEVTTMTTHSTPTETENEIAALLKDSKYPGMGASIFTAKCAACHRDDLGGQIGPNLTDHFWLHGKGTRLDIAKAVRDGIPDKGMPPWGAILSKDEVYGVIAYILSKKDSQPANPKDPQGEKAE